MRKIAMERNALLSSNLKVQLKRLIALEDGNIQIRHPFIPFEWGRTPPEGTQVIQAIGKGLLDILDTSDVIIVSGFTDDTPIKSSTYTNWNLSAERAINVVKTLIAQGSLQIVFCRGLWRISPQIPKYIR